MNDISGSPLHWLIVKPLVHQTDVLTLRSRRRGGTYLPVFSHEGEAAKFLCYHTEASEGGWRVRETSASELALLLQRQGAAVQRVVLDPVPEDIAEALVELLSLDREEFVRILLAEEPLNLRGCTSSLAPLLTKAVSETTGAGAAAPTIAVPCLGASQSLAESVEDNRE